MLSARQLLLMRRARDRTICLAIAPLGTVLLLPDPDFRRRVSRRVSHVGLSCVARSIGRMDRVASVGYARATRGHEGDDAPPTTPMSSRRFMSAPARPYRAGQASILRALCTGLRAGR